MPAQRVLRRGDHVLWAPTDDRVAEIVPLAHGHPGRVEDPVGDTTVSVAWVDREGTLALEGAFDVTWLVRVSSEEFEQRAATVRRRRRAREDAGRSAGRTYLPRPH